MYSIVELAPVIQPANVSSLGGRAAGVIHFVRPCTLLLWNRLTYLIADCPVHASPYSRDAYTRVNDSVGHATCLHIRLLSDFAKADTSLHTPPAVQCLRQPGEPDLRLTLTPVQCSLL